MSQIDKMFELYTPPKSPAKAALISLLTFGGGGQIYLGQTKRGLLYIVLSLIGSPFLIGLPVWALGVWDAYQIAKKLQSDTSLESLEESTPIGPLTEEKVEAPEFNTNLRIIDRGLEFNEVRQWQVPLNNCGNTNPTTMTVKQALVCERKAEFGDKYKYQIGPQATLKVPIIGKLALEIRSLLENHFRQTLGTTHIEERTLELTAEGGTNMLFTLAIKESWRKGEIVRQRSSFGFTETIPFRVQVGTELELVSSQNVGC